MVKKEISLSIASDVGNNSKDGNAPALRMQNPEPVEIFNSGSLERGRPFCITPLMREVEGEHGDIPIDRLLHSFYWEQKKSPRQIGMELKRPKDTIYSWLVDLGVGRRSAKDAVLVWRAGRQPSEMKVKNSPTKIKLTEVEKTFEIESEEKIKALLEAMYKQYQSWGAMAKAFRESGINVGSTIVRNWISYFGIDTNALLEEDNRNCVQNAVENGGLDDLTDKQRNVLESRGYFREGQLIPFRKLEEVQSKTITYQTACDNERAALKKLKKRAHARLIMEEQVSVVRKPVGRPKREMFSV